VYRRFTEEEVDRVWDMHQAGVPVKRIARPDLGAPKRLDAGSDQ
jgi:hypothetical protein